MNQTKFLIAVIVSIYFCSVSSAQKPRTTVVDSLIVGGTVVTMDKTHRVIENGAVAIKADKVVAVGNRAEIAGRYRSARTIDATGRAIIPGLINTHTHSDVALPRDLR